MEIALRRLTELAVHGSRATLVRVQAERLVQRINLHLALGGGFDASPATVAHTQESP